MQKLSTEPVVRIGNLSAMIGINLVGLGLRMA